MQFKHNNLVSKFCTHDCHVSSFKFCFYHVLYILNFFYSCSFGTHVSVMFRTFLIFVIHVVSKHMFLSCFRTYVYFLLYVIF